MMNPQELDEFLKSEDEIEQLQRQQGININEMELDYSQPVPPKIQRKTLFTEGNIYINKQRRYAPVPEHTHSFVEMNYMYSGHCVQYINGEEVELKQGDLLIIDRNAVQRIENTGKDDILINILLKEETISTEILANLASSNNLVLSFMINATQKNGPHKTFIHFSAANGHTRLKNLIINMLLVYFQAYDHKTKTLNLYLSLVLIELSNLFKVQSRDRLMGYVDGKVVEVLEYIDNNYTKVTLNGVADHFGYNPVYLSNKLRKNLGYSFKDLVNRKRYTSALELINETDLSLEEIANQVGYKQTSSLFKLIKKYTDKRPNQLRNKNIK